MSRQSFFNTLKSLEQNTQLEVKQIEYVNLPPKEPNFWHTTYPLTLKIVINSVLGGQQIDVPILATRTWFGWQIQPQPDSWWGTIFAQLPHQLTFDPLIAHQGTVFDKNNKPLSQPLSVPVVWVALDKISNSSATVEILHRLTNWQKVELEQLLRVNQAPNRQVRVGPQKLEVTNQIANEIIKSDSSITVVPTPSQQRIYTSMSPTQQRFVETIEKTKQVVGENGGVLFANDGSISTTLWQKPPVQGGDVLLSPLH